MKTNYRIRKSVFGILVMALMLFALLFSLASPPTVQAQVVPNDFLILTNIPSVITNIVVSWGN